MNLEIMGHILSYGNSKLIEIDELLENHLIKFLIVELKRLSIDEVNNLF